MIKRRTLIIDPVDNGFILREDTHSIGSCLNELAVFNKIDDMNMFIKDYYSVENQEKEVIQSTG